MKISFIIVNYRSEMYLEECLASIFRKIKKIDLEIILINNDIKKIKGLSCKKKYLNKIIIIENNRNVGFARANNLGVNESSGDILCFINPDARIISENINNLVDEFVISSDVGIIGPKILKEGNVQPWSVGVDMNIFEILRSKIGFSKSKEKWLCNQKTEVDWVSGVSLFIKKDLFLSVGGFDEKFFLYYEDVDLCKRIKKIGKKIIYFPSFEINHLEGKSSRGIYEQKLEYFKAQDYYYKKWFNFWSRYFLKFFVFFYLLKYRFK